MPVEQSDGLSTAIATLLLDGIAQAAGVDIATDIALLDGVNTGMFGATLLHGVLAGVFIALLDGVNTGTFGATLLHGVLTGLGRRLSIHGALSNSNNW